MPIEVNTEALGEILRAAREFRKIPQSQAAAIALNEGRNPRSDEGWERLDTSIWMIAKDLDKYWGHQ